MPWRIAMEPTPAPYYGPTVVEAAEARLRAIARKIEELQLEARACRARIKEYQGSMMGEAERLATAAEPYQSTQLPTYWILRSTGDSYLQEDRSIGPRDTAYRFHSIEAAERCRLFRPGFELVGV